jgi:hypothetical protein
MRTAPSVGSRVEDRDWLENVSWSQVVAVRLSERALLVVVPLDTLARFAREVRRCVAWEVGKV